MYIRKIGAKWRAEIQIGGFRKSSSFDTRAEAKEWAVRMEAAHDPKSHGGHSSIALVDAIDADLGPDADRWTRNRLLAFAKAIKKPRLRDIDAADITAWRNARKRQVSDSTINREANLLRGFFRRAVTEHRWITASPFDGVAIPKGGPPRHQRWGWRDIRRVCRSLGYVTGKPPATKSEEVAYAFLIALRTAMRASEILNAELHGSVVHLTKTKTTQQGQLVKIPLPPGGDRLLKLVKFTITPESLDALFRKAKRRTLVDDLTFHDARATALTWLSRKVDPLTLAKISRHKDLSMLLEVYYRETAEEIAARLRKR